LILGFTLLLGRLPGVLGLWVGVVLDLLIHARSPSNVCERFPSGSPAFPAAKPG
jgi:hypothetical protein